MAGLEDQGNLSRPRPRCTGRKDQGKAPRAQRAKGRRRGTVAKATWRNWTGKSTGWLWRFAQRTRPNWRKSWQLVREERDTVKKRNSQRQEATLCKSIGNRTGTNSRPTPEEIATVDERTRPYCGELLRRFVAKIECRWSVRPGKHNSLPVAGSARRTPRHPARAQLPASGSAIARPTLPADSLLSTSAPRPRKATQATFLLICSFQFGKSAEAQSENGNTGFPVSHKLTKAGNRWRKTKHCLKGSTRPSLPIRIESGNGS